MDFGTKNPTIWVLGPSGIWYAFDFLSPKTILDRHMGAYTRTPRGSLKDLLKEPFIGLT